MLSGGGREWLEYWRVKDLDMMGSKLDENGLECLNRAVEWARRGCIPLIGGRDRKGPVSFGWEQIGLGDWMKNADKAVLTHAKKSGIALCVRLNGVAVCLDVDKNLEHDGRDLLLTRLSEMGGVDARVGVMWKERKWMEIVESAQYVEASPSGGWHVIWKVGAGGLGLKDQDNFGGTHCDLIMNKKALIVSPSRYSGCQKRKGGKHAKCGRAGGEDCAWLNREYVIKKEWIDEEGKIPVDLLELMVKSVKGGPTKRKRKVGEERGEGKMVKHVKEEEVGGEEDGVMTIMNEEGKVMGRETVCNFLRLLDPKTSKGLEVDEKTWKQYKNKQQVRLSAIGEDGWWCILCNKCHDSNGAIFKFQILMKKGSTERIFDCCLVCLAKGALAIRKLLNGLGEEEAGDPDDVMLEDGPVGNESHGLDVELWNKVYRIPANQNLRSTLFCVKMRFENRAEFESKEPGSRGCVWDEEKGLWEICTVLGLRGIIEEDCATMIRNEGIIVEGLIKQASTLGEISILEKVKARIEGIKKQLKTESGMKSILRSIQFRLIGKKVHEQLNGMDHLLPIAHKKVIDLRDGSVRERTWEDYFTVESSVIWLNDEEMETEEVKEKARYLMNGLERMCGRADEGRGEYERAEYREVLDGLQLILGYSITGNIRLKNWFYFYQPGSNGGKSALTIGMKRVIGPFFDAVKGEVIMRDKGTKMHGMVGGHNSGMARLMNKRCGMTNEVNPGSRIEEKAILGLSGFDEQSAREVGKAEVVFESKLKLIVLANDRIEIDYSHEALSRRVIWLTLPIRFVTNPEGANERKVDTSWRERLAKDEIIQSLFLRWLVEGSKRSYSLPADASTLLDYLPRCIQDENKELRQENKSAMWQYVNDEEVFVVKAGSGILMKEFLEYKEERSNGGERRQSLTEVRSELERMSISVALHNTISRKTGKRCKQLCVLGLAWVPTLQYQK